LRKRREEEESEFSVARSLSGDRNKIEFYVFATNSSSSKNTPPPAPMKKTIVESNKMVTPKLKQLVV
jgi:hypothetical protein